MYNLIEYSDNYSKTSGFLSEYCREKTALNNRTILDLTADNTITDFFKIK